MVKHIMEIFFYYLLIFWPHLYSRQQDGQRGPSVETLRSSLPFSYQSGEMKIIRSPGSESNPQPLQTRSHCATMALTSTYVFRAIWNIFCCWLKMNTIFSIYSAAGMRCGLFFTGLELTLDLLSARSRAVFSRHFNANLPPCADFVGMKYLQQTHFVPFQFTAAE